MHLAFVVRAPTAGGAERQLALLARGLVAAGERVTIVLFRDEGELREEFVASGAQLVVLGLRGAWSVPGGLVRLVRALRRLRPDVVHPYLTTSNVLIALLAPLLRPARIVWGVRNSGLRPTEEPLALRLLLRLEHALCRVPDLIVANSSAGAALMVAAGAPATRCVVVPNGVDAARWGAIRRSPGALGLPRIERAFPRIVTLAARLHPMKGIERFVDAAALVAGRRRDVAFAVIGGGRRRYAETLLQRAIAAGIADRFAIVAEPRPMDRLLAGTDVLCSASLHGEGFPNVLAEAQAAGVAVAATAVGDAASIVLDPAALAPADDAVALAAAIEHALDAPADAAAARRAAMADRFGVERLVERTRAALTRSAAS